MSTTSRAVDATTLADELRMLRSSWIWFLVLGIAMVAIGTFAISWACITTITVAATWLFGFLMIAGGIAEIVNSFYAGRWSGTLVHLLLGVLYAAVGLMIVDQPLDAAEKLTLIIAIFLILSGIFRIVFAISERFTGWGWVLLNGAVTLFLGILIYKQWPSSGLWVIGLFIGIDLIFNGWAWIMLAIGLRTAPKTV
ncbi:MAG: HdeD family acid-resistance protein [Planctomycetes bacterium]|nr:HdeD family acid-resistance protein [Planctomycetota bacterium]